MRKRRWECHSDYRLRARSAERGTSTPLRMHGGDRAGLERGTELHPQVRGPDRAIMGQIGTNRHKPAGRKCAAQRGRKAPCLSLRALELPEHHLPPANGRLLYLGRVQPGRSGAVGGSYRVSRVMCATGNRFCRSVRDTGGVWGGLE